jgi:cell division protein FtsW
MKISRTDRSRFTDWWFTVDRVLLAGIFAIITAGVVLSLAASPSTAAKRGLPTFYFFERHIIFAVLSVALMLAVSFLSPPSIRRLALGVMLTSFAMIGAGLLLGPEVNGAKRWLRLGSHSFQPSEFAKPAFMVLSAWLLVERQRRADVPAMSLAIALFVAFATLLILQPDIGQTLLISLTWGAIFILSGQPIRQGLQFIVAACAGIAIAYGTLPHVHLRVDRFFDRGPGDSYQADRAIQSFVEGGFFGRGPGEGTIKSVLPDANTDYIFAVIAEEYGVLACLVILGLFAFVTLRTLARAYDEPDAFSRHCMQGLALLVAAQALINMAVNVGLLPAKGMTLPFISTGGSSMLAMGLTSGWIIALSRHRPSPDRVRKPILVMSSQSMRIKGLPRQ